MQILFEDLTSFKSFLLLLISVYSEQLFLYLACDFVSFFLIKQACGMKVVILVNLIHFILWVSIHTPVWGVTVYVFMICVSAH